MKKRLFKWLLKNIIWWGGSSLDELLRIEGLTKRYPTFNLTDICFSLEKGCIMGLIGENGAGKTTLIKLILNAIEEDEGTITLFGMDHKKEEIKVKEKIGYVPAEDYFTASSTLNKHANMIKVFYSDWDDKLFGALCTSWNLPLHQKIYEFSKGMKTKAMLALALAHRPSLLILDEPTAGLDPVARIEILDILRQFVENGERSIFLSTHTTVDLDKIADFITLIHKGKLKESLSVDQIEEKYALIEGDIQAVEGKEEAFIGFRKGKVKFEGLMLRSTAELFFAEEYIKRPNIEDLLVYTIWGDKDETSLQIIKSL